MSDLEALDQLTLSKAPGETKYNVRKVAHEALVQKRFIIDPDCEEIKQMKCRFLKVLHDRVLDFTYLNLNKIAHIVIFVDTYYPAGCLFYEERMAYKDYIGKNEMPKWIEEYFKKEDYPKDSWKIGSIRNNTSLIAAVNLEYTLPAIEDVVPISLD